MEPKHPAPTGRIINTRGEANYRYGTSTVGAPEIGGGDIPIILVNEHMG
jgi:hypothetical protein